jgi:hypothetical protein
VLARVVDRETRDLDFFGPSADEVDDLAAAVEMALNDAGMDVQRERISHGFARLTVTDGRTVTEVDLGADARIRPTEPGLYGPTLSLEELAADKLLALLDRAQARDFIDVGALVRRLGLERLCEVAAEKDHGFSRAALREALGTFGRFSTHDLGVDEPGRQRLAAAVQQWQQILLVPRPQRRIHGPDTGPSL